MVESSLYLASKFSSCFFNEISQSLNLKSMVGIAILQLISQTFEISFIQLSYLNFGEFNFPFIVLDYFFNFMLELEIVLLDQLQSMLLTSLELFVDIQNTSDFLLFGGNDRL